MSRQASASRIALDEVFVFRMKALHSILAPLMYDSLKNRLAKDKAFKQKYEEWVKKQGWTLNEERHRNIADQATYILINKILFYKALERKKNLPPLTKKEKVTELLETMRECFEAALKIDYRAVFQRDPIYDEIPLTPEAAQRLNILIEEVSEYDLSKMKRDVIGTLYEKLIPKDERRTLGQFYTPPQIVELIVRMCVRNPDDKVLDPGCGSGGFLVASYDRLLKWKGKTETDEETHQEILSQIWGVDINKFPAHLATINLANQNLESLSDHINVIVSDFFDIKEPKQRVLAPWSVASLNNRRKEVEIPIFDAIVANPPYTRHQDIPKFQKEKIRLVSLNGKKVKFDARAGIYAYFFLHGINFLRNGKRMGMIVSNAWLDVSYGKDLQRFFLEHFKIIAIIEADRRVFTDAEVNTVVVILEKANSKTMKDDRDKNLVKFVRVKKRVEIDQIIDAVKTYNYYHEDDRIRVYPKAQAELWEEGYNEEKKRYEGTMWGAKYLRAPKIFFRIIEKGRNKLKKLDEVTEVETYLNTGGADDYFFVQELSKEKEEADILNLKYNKKFSVENEFVNDFIESPRELESITVSTQRFNKKLFRVPIELSPSKLRKKKAWKYINFGSNQGFDRVSGRKGKKRWYILPPQAYDGAEILVPCRIGEMHAIFYNPKKIISHRFYRLKTLKKNMTKPMVLLLNSTLSYLCLELFRNPMTGGGVLDIGKPAISSILVIEPKSLADKTDQFNGFLKRKTMTVFQECGIDRNKPTHEQEPRPLPDRKKLDDIIFDILGLSREERLEVYRALIDLVRRRITKSREIGVLVGPEIEHKKPWPLSSKELEEIVTLLQLSKVGRLTEEQESTLGRRAGKVVRDLAYEIIRLRHEPMSVNEVAQKILDIGDDILNLAGYYKVISEVMGRKTTPKQVIRDLLSIWRDQPEGIQKTISRLLSGDGRFLQIERSLFGLNEWSPNELFQIYVQLVSKYRTTNNEKKETFKSQAINLLESGEVNFPDKKGLIQTLRRL